MKQRAKILSSVTVTEHLVEIEEIEQPIDSKFDLFENTEFISFVHDLGISEILNTTIKFGIVKTKSIYNGDDITIKPETFSFYNDKVLYINYKASKKEVVNALCLSVLHNKDHSLKLEEFINNLSK